MNDNKNNQWEESFDGLSLPGQESSWQKMKQLLDEDDREHRTLPFFKPWMGMAGLALILAAAIGLWMFNRNNTETRLASATPTDSHSQPSTNRLSSNPARSSQPGKPIADPANASHQQISIPSSNSYSSNAPATPGRQQSVTRDKNVTNAPVSVITHNSPDNPKSTHSAINTLKGAPVSQGGKPSLKAGSPANEGVHTSERTTRQPLASSAPVHASQAVFTSLVPGARLQQPVLQPLVLSPVFSPIVKPAASLENQPVVKTHTKRFTLSGGLGLQQQIPIMGQTSVPYNYYGRKNSVSDYLPSAYLRLQRNGKWFLLGEFRYGAPQALHEFSYSRKTELDTSSVTITTLRLKKTYYHQFPLSFNYFVKPSLSVGTGVVYSRFFGAVSEREVRNRNLQNQTETLSKSIVQIKEFTDSFLYRSQVHVLFQANYDWRRFSFGLRYTKDVEPYIRYTQPDGMINQRKNQTLQAVVRFTVF